MVWRDDRCLGRMVVHGRLELCNGQDRAGNGTNGAQYYPFDPSVLDPMRTFSWIGGCLASAASLAQPPDTAPSYAEALASIDHGHMFLADSVFADKERSQLRPTYGSLTGTIITKDTTDRLIFIEHRINGRATGTSYGTDSAGRVTYVLFEDKLGRPGGYASYYPSGRVHTRGPYKRDTLSFCRIFRGVADGDHLTFYEDGPLRQCVRYREGRSTAMLNWYPNGRLASFYADSAGTRTLRQWCPDGRVIGNMQWSIPPGGPITARGYVMLLHERSREPFRMVAHGKRWVFTSLWDHERLVARSEEEAARIIRERHLDEYAFQDTDQPPPFLSCDACTDTR